MQCQHDNLGQSYFLNCAGLDKTLDLDLTGLALMFSCGTVRAYLLRDYLLRGDVAVQFGCHISA